VLSECRGAKQKDDHECLHMDSVKPEPQITQKSAQSAAEH
jgi:hypothetical protein